MAEDNGNQVLTTGAAAKLSLVSQQTIIRCIDSGALKGYRVPGSSHRRVMLRDVLEFMRTNNIPNDHHDKQLRPKIVLWANNSLKEISELEAALRCVKTFTVSALQDAWEAASSVQDASLFIADLNLAEVSSSKLGPTAHISSILQRGVKVVPLVKAGDAELIGSLKSLSFSSNVISTVFERPIESKAVVNFVKAQLGV